ncbi:MAG TPA: response regulator transcription factor [Cyclobacteriaceae bacterium]
MKQKIKVYIADDHTLFRKAMVNLLRTFKYVSEVKDAENGQDLLALMKNEVPDVAIVDLQMPIMDGAETCEHILEKYPDVKIIVLTMHDSDRYVLHMMEMGAHAFLLKNTEPDELERAIHSVIEKDFYHNEWVVTILRKNVKAQRPNFSNDDLTDREKQIVQLVCRELSSKQIAEKLFVSERTIENHRATIMKKLGVKNTIGLVHYAYQIGIMS